MKGVTGPPCSSGGAENGPPLNVSTHNPAPGQQVSANMPAGSCAPGATVTTALIQIPSNGTGTQFSSGTADNTGAFSAAGNVPAATNVLYILYSMCKAGDGTPAVYTTPIIVGNPNVTHARANSQSASGGASGTSGGNSATASSGSAGSSAPQWNPPTASNMPPQAQQAVVAAVNATATAYESSLGQTLSVHHSTSSSNNAARDGLIAGVLAVAGAGLMTLRLRRRPASN
ncbi:MAG TPA: hypothetical protein VFP54_12085 [Acidimicrobiales bacterium]|nr:hypothetical protein [Acidimicrobiales bacterium]